MRSAGGKSTQSCFEYFLGSRINLARIVMVDNRKTESLPCLFLQVYLRSVLAANIYNWIYVLVDLHTAYERL